MGKKTSSFIGLFLLASALFTVGSSRTLWEKYIKKRCELQVIDSEISVKNFNKSGVPTFAPLIAFRSAKSNLKVKLENNKILDLIERENIPWWRLMQATFDLTSAKFSVTFRLGEDDPPINVTFQGTGKPMSILAENVWITKGDCITEDGDLPYEIVKTQSKSEITHLLPITGETDFLIFSEKKMAKSHLRITSYYGDLDVCLSINCGTLTSSPVEQKEDCGALMPGLPHWLTFVYDKKKRKYAINGYPYEIGRYFSFDNRLGESTEEYYIIRCLNNCNRNGTSYPKYDVIAEECQLELIIVSVLVLVAALVDLLFVKRQWTIHLWIKSMARMKEKNEEEKKKEEEEQLARLNKGASEQAPVPPLPSSPPPELPLNPPPLLSSPPGPSSPATPPPPPPPLQHN